MAMTMPMNCLGPHPRDRVQPTTFEWMAAQYRVKELFQADFTVRRGKGEVFTERDYKNIIVRDCPALERVRRVLDSDFNNDANQRRARRPDALGITCDGRHGELIEVTTVDNAASAIAQVVTKMATLQWVSQFLQSTGALSFLVEWEPARWRPTQLYYDPVSGSSRLVTFNDLGEARWICYQPTYRVNAPPGVVLYEIHSVRLRDPRPVPVPIPSDIEERLKEAARNNRPTEQTAESWVREFLTRNPAISGILRGLAFIVGAAALIVAIILIFDLIPGDEAAVAAVAMWLLVFAMQGENRT